MSETTQDRSGLDGGNGADGNAGAPEAAGANAGAPGNGTSPQPERSWRDDIKDEKVRNFAKTFQSPAEMAEKAFGLRQKVSRSIEVPGRDASPDARAAYNKAIGVPDGYDGYGIVHPDGADADPGAKARLDGFLKSAHAAGMTKSQVDGVLGWYSQALQDAAAEQIRASRTATQKAIDRMKAEEGGDFERNSEIAIRAFRAFGDDDAEAFFEKTEIDGIPLGSHPAMRRFALNVGMQLQEAPPMLAAADSLSGSLEDQHRKLSAEINDALDRGDRATAERLDEQRNRIAQKIVGTGPIVGAPGVTG